MTAAVHHRPAERRFETVVDGARGEAVYRMVDGVMELVHTEVDHSIRGRGIGAALIAAALDHARREGLKVRAVCSYARRYLREHPEDRDLEA